MKGSISGLIVFASIIVILMGLPAASSAQVNVNIGVFAPPPRFVVHAPPSMAVIPGTYVYVVPDIEVEMLFYQGHWYRPFEGRWYRGNSYNGPWAHLPPARVPRAVLELPPDYRRLPPGYAHIPHGEFKKNWAHWERDRHWERNEAWRRGRPGPHDERGPHGKIDAGPPGPPGRGFDDRGGPHGKR